MRRLLAALLPAPLLSAGLFAAWLMLNGSLAAAQLMLGALLALAVPQLTASPSAKRTTLRRIGVALRLTGVVLRDIVRSNIELARRILGSQKAIRPGFVWLPLDLRDPRALVALAGIITLTPGTLSADFSDDRRHLLIHVFHLTDAAALIAKIKTRYEAPLTEIFE